MSGRLKITLFLLVFITVLGMVYMEMKGRDSLHFPQVPWNYRIKKVKPTLPSITPVPGNEIVEQTSQGDSRVNDLKTALSKDQESYLESFSEIRRKEIEQKREEELRRDKELVEQKKLDDSKLEQPIHPSFPE